ncbi:histone deacetylase [Candidatus Micrarchaeota archaeon]|nr:histone deacetylase [Candidatus Micrarchaeota archaeon]
MVSIVYSERFLEHETDCGHPESPERLQAILDYLEKTSFFKRYDIEVVAPEKIDEKTLELVHLLAYIQQLKLLSSKERTLSSDNPFNKNTFEIASLACAAAFTAAKKSIEANSFSFALVRPPGHHAGKAFFQGFCYLNNIAYAVRRIQKEKQLKKALIVDFDLHHGNGTQDIFYSDDSVYYLSLHQDPSFTFPFHSGFEEENNFHIKNIPLGEGTGDRNYLELFKKAVSEAVEEFKPEIIGVSAGFDIYFADAAVGSRLEIRETKTFEEIGKIIRESAEKNNCPVFGVLEGGYYLRKLGENFSSLLTGFL